MCVRPIKNDQICQFLITRTHICFWRHVCKDREHKKPLRGNYLFMLFCVKNNFYWEIEIFSCFFFHAQKLQKSLKTKNHFLKKISGMVTHVNWISSFPKIIKITWFCVFKTIFSSWKCCFTNTRRFRKNIFCVCKGMFCYMSISQGSDHL